MNILHITYYKSINPGTFLQAYAVQKGLKEIFPNSIIHTLKANYRKNNRQNVGMVKISRSELFYGKFYTAIRLLKFRRNLYDCFIETKKRVDAFSLREINVKKLFDNYDMIVIGGDTILERIAIEQMGVMWGSLNSETPQLFFSASGDDCSNNMEQSQFFNKLKRNIDNFKFIGLRDDIIANFLTNKIGVKKDKIIIQPDPTYLLNLNIFKINENKLKKINQLNGKKVFFHFDRRFGQRKLLANQLKKAGYSLITPEYDPDCDVSLKFLNPFEWGALFEYCDIIITERFHDTILGLRYLKPVFTIDWNKNKVNVSNESKRTQVLKQYNLLDYHFFIYSDCDVENMVSNIHRLTEEYDTKKVDALNNILIARSSVCLDKIKSVVLMS